MRQRTRYGGIVETLDSLTLVGKSDVVAMSQTATGSIVASGVRLRRTVVADDVPGQRPILEVS